MSTSLRTLHVVVLTQPDAVAEGIGRAARSAGH